MNNIYPVTYTCYTGVMVVGAVLLASLENVSERYAPTFVFESAGRPLNILEQILLGFFRLLVTLLKLWRRFILGTILVSVKLLKIYIKYSKARKIRKAKRVVKPGGVDYRGRTRIR